MMTIFGCIMPTKGAYKAKTGFAIAPLLQNRHYTRLAVL